MDSGICNHHRELFHDREEAMILRLPILLTATSQTRTLFFLLSLFTLILLGILIEGLIKGRFLGKVIAKKRGTPFFYYSTVAMLVWLIFQLSILLKDLIH